MGGGEGESGKGRSSAAWTLVFVAIPFVIILGLVTAHLLPLYLTWRREMKFAEELWAESVYWSVHVEAVSYPDWTSFLGWRYRALYDRVTAVAK